MAKAEIIFAVYEPPKDGLPYLAVAIFPDGQVISAPYATQLEAQQHQTMAALEAAQTLKPK